MKVVFALISQVFLLAFVTFFYNYKTIGQSKFKKPDIRNAVKLQNQNHLKINSLKELESKIVKAFDVLTFNGASLKDNGIILRNYPYGLAFAFFNPKTQNRIIFVNYKYLFESYITKLTEEDKETFLNGVKAVLIHEWSHHFLGHNLKASNILNERNADILTGRILEENRVNNIEIVLKELELKESRFHLPKEERQDLIIKGKKTFSILEKINNRKNEGFEIEEYKIDLLINGLYSDAKIQLEAFRKIEISKLKKAINKYSKPDSVYNLFVKDVNLSNIEKLDSIKAKYTSDTIIGKRIEKFVKIIKSKAVGNFLSKDSDNFEMLYCLYNLPLNAKDKINDIYNLLKLKLIKTDSVNALLKLLKPLISNETYNEKFIYYKLKGNIELSIDCTDLTITYFENKSKHKLKNKLIEMDNSIFFIYTFFIEKNRNKEIYYLDKNYNLWSDTIAAKKIDNKLFLQMNALRLKN